MSNGKTAKRPRYDSLLNLMSAYKVSQVKNLLEAKPKAQPSGAWKRKVAKVLEPALSCFEQLTVPASDEEAPVQFWSADIAKLLNYVCDSSPFFLDRMRLLNNSTLELLWTMDDSTGGNVLATSPWLKTCLFYFAIKNLGEIHRPSAWLPLAAAPVRDVTDAQGGASAITAAILHHFNNQKVHDWIWIRDVSVKVRILAYCGDYDSIRAIWSTKGSSALKPCCVCKNVIMKRSHAAAADSYFQPLGSAEVDSFERLGDDELHDQFDTFMGELSTWTKSKRETTEKLLGFSLQQGNLLGNPVARRLLPLSKLVLDATHCYFANGIAAQEVVLLMHFLENQLGITLKNLQTAVGEVCWKCANPRFNSSSKRKYLFEETFWKGDLYKGNATDVYYLLPLLCYYAATLCRGHTDSPHIQSFIALCQVIWMSNSSKFLLRVVFLDPLSFRLIFSY